MGALDTASLLVRKYFASVFFPTVVGWAIYADYSHTQKWKREKQFSSVKKDNEFAD